MPDCGIRHECYRLRRLAEHLGLIMWFTAFWHRVRANRRLTEHFFEERL